MHEQYGQSITRYNLCTLGCSVYSKALSATDLQASFHKTGIYPYSPKVVNPSNFTPLEALQQELNPETTVIYTPGNPANEQSQLFTSKVSNFTTKMLPIKKSRYLSTVVSCEAITEAYMVDKIRDHENAKTVKSTKKSKSQKNKSQPQPSGATRPTTSTVKDTDIIESDV